MLRDARLGGRSFLHRARALDHLLKRESIDEGETKMILVTGAGGTVGSEVLKQLRAAGADTRAAFHSKAKAEKAKAAGIDSVTLDFADRSSITAALRGVDKLFLLGATTPDQVQ